MNYFRALWAALMGRTHPVADLAPGVCECNHKRCHHMRAMGKCMVAVGEGVCACEIYIRAVPITADELEALYQK